VTPAAAESKKLDSSSQNSAQAGGCVDSNCAPTELRLNVSALSDPNSLMPSVSIMSPVTIPPVSALVDSGSSHCFIDSKFDNKHSLETYMITLLELRLLDGSTNTFITKAIKLDIQFSTGEVNSKTFYVTPLDSSCMLVLGHSWLAHYNPLIDWVLGHIEFCKGTLRMPASPVPPSVESASASASMALPPEDSSPPSDSDSPQLTAPYVSFIGAAAFAHACKLTGSTNFMLYIRPEDMKLRSASAASPVDSSNLSGSVLLNDLTKRSRGAGN